MSNDESDAPPSATDVDPFESDELSGDVPDDLDDAVTVEWKASATAFQRLHTVLNNTYELQTTGELAERAATTKPTVRKHVEPLVDAGMVVEREYGNATEYAWNDTQRRVSRIAELASEHTSSELDAKIRRAKIRIEALEEKYDVESPNDLVTELPPDDDDGWDDLSVWRTLEDDLKRLEVAQTMKEYLAESGSAGTDVSNHV